MERINSTPSTLVVEDGGMLNFTPEAIIALPVDERGMAVLQDLVNTNQWSEHSYSLEYQAPTDNAIAEAMAWLRGRAFIARKPGQPNSDAFIVTARGHEALGIGLRAVRAVERLDYDMHHLIEQRARRQFLLGEYEQAVFVAMKAVEVRVRALACLGDNVVGVTLMTQAFRQEGPLTDPQAVPGEQVGVMNLFQGAYAVLRNPAGHREVDYDNVTEAAEAVATASLLMRILDRVETRVSNAGA